MQFDMLTPRQAVHLLPAQVVLTRDGLAPEITQLANALSQRHGHVTVTVEKSGAHLNMACPNCLLTEGARELQPGRRHLAVNAEKYLSLGKWFGSPSVDTAASCMKCSKIYKISNLLQFAPLTERGYSQVSKVNVNDNSKWIITRGGHDIPGGPGMDSNREGVIPLTRLPEDHPAVVYLKLRGYDLAALEHQFDAAYCETEWEENKAEGRYHKRLVGGMKDSHQGRIIFFSQHDGVQLGYQGRIIEHTWEQVGAKYRSFWCGQSRQWKTFETMSPDGTWILNKPWSEETAAWPPSKYKNASGAHRNSMLFGLDAAVRWNNQHRAGQKPFALVVEGPLDAGRFGAPAIARIGKYLSEEQIRILANRFSAIFLVPDNDEAGLRSVEDDKQRASAKMLCHVLRVPEFCPVRGTKLKDPGDMHTSTASEMLAHACSVL